METSYCHVDRPVGTGVGINRRSEDRMFTFIPDRVPAWGSLYPSIVMEELGRDHFSPYNSWTRGGKTCEWVSSPVLAKLAKIGPLEEKVKERCEGTKVFFFGRLFSEWYTFTVDGFINRSWELQKPTDLCLSACVESAIFCCVWLHMCVCVCECACVWERERLKCSSRGKVLTTLIILYFLQTWRSFCAPVSWDSLPLLIFFEIQFHFIPSLSSTYKTPSSIILLTFISVLFDGQVRSKGQFGSLFCQWLQSIWEKGPFSEHLCVTER